MSTTKRRSLDVIDIARPCPADWSAMRGNDRARFCNHCSLHVYNLSDMTRPQAEALVERTEGKICVRFYRRADGTVITRDCGGGWKLAAKRIGRWASAATALLLAAMGLSQSSSASSTQSQGASCAPTFTGSLPTAQTEAYLGRMRAPASQPAVMGEAAPLMGSPAPLPPSTQPASTQPTR